MNLTPLERICLAVLNRLEDAWLAHIRRTEYRRSAPWGVS